MKTKKTQRKSKTSGAAKRLVKKPKLVAKPLDPRVFEINPTVFYRSLTPQTIAVIDLSAEEDLYQVDGVAAAILKSLDGESTVSDLATMIGGNPRAAKVFTKVIARFISDLVKMGLVSKVRRAKNS